MDDLKQRAKMEIIMELLGMSEGMMGEDLGSFLSKPKEVTVAAKDDDALVEGLDAAKDVVKGDDDIMKEAASAMLSDMDSDDVDTPEHDEDELEEDEDDMRMFGSKEPKVKQKSKFNMLGED